MYKNFKKMFRVEEDNELSILAYSLILNQVDTCGFGSFSAFDFARKIIQTLKQEGYELNKT